MSTRDLAYVGFEAMELRHVVAAARTASDPEWRVRTSVMASSAPASNASFMFSSHPWWGGVMTFAKHCTLYDANCRKFLCCLMDFTKSATPELEPPPPPPPPPPPRRRDAMTAAAR